MHTFLRLAIVVAFAILAVPGTASAQAAPFCRPGQQPQFTEGFAVLKARLGPTMGNPIECPHPNDANGDVIQNTSTGLSFWRKSTNTPTFTDGFRHWGLTPQGDVFWEGASIDPPGRTMASTPAPTVRRQGLAPSFYMPLASELPLEYDLDVSATSGTDSPAERPTRLSRAYWIRGNADGYRHEYTVFVADSAQSAQIAYDTTRGILLDRGWEFKGVGSTPREDERSSSGYLDVPATASGPAVYLQTQIHQVGSVLIVSMGTTTSQRVSNYNWTLTGLQVMVDRARAYPDGYR